MDEDRPSERFCKHGFLFNERYNPEIHYGSNLEERSRRFYTPEEITRCVNKLKIINNYCIIYNSNT